MARFAHAGLGEVQGAVLVVDDHDQVLEVLKAGIEAMGFAVDVAGGGADALPLLDSRHYDAVICDLVMPRVTGYDLFHMCAQKRPELARCFIFLSGLPWGKSPLHTPAVDAQPFLAKPCRLDDIRCALRRVMVPAT